MTTSISPKRKRKLINELVLCHMLCPEDFREFSFRFPLPFDPKVTNGEPNSVTWNGMYYIDDITAKKFGLKSGEITMVKLPISDKQEPQFCLISDSIWRAILFPNDIERLFSVELLSRRPELCQKLVTSEQWDTFLDKVPSLVDRSQLLTESDLAYVRGIATQAWPYRLPKDCFFTHIHRRIEHLCVLLAIKYRLVYRGETDVHDDDLVYRLHCIQRLVGTLRDESLPVSCPTADESVINSIQIVEV